MKRSVATLWGRLADESRRTVLGFLFKVACVVPFIIIGRHPAVAVQSIAFIFGLWCTAFALLRRQHAYGPNLNYWDEALWFFAAAHTVGFWIHGESVPEAAVG